MAGILSKKLQSYVSNYSFNHWRGGKKKVWRDSLNLFQSLKCKRTSEVKSTFSVTFYPPLISIILVVCFGHSGYFVLVVLFWSFCLFHLFRLVISFCFFRFLYMLIRFEFDYKPSEKILMISTFL